VESLDCQYLETGFGARSEAEDRYGKKHVASYQLQMLPCVLELKLKLKFP